MPHDSTDPATVARAGSHASIAATPEKRASPALNATHDKKFARSPSTAPHPRTDSTDDTSAGTPISPLVPKETDPGVTVTRSRPTPPSHARASNARPHKPFAATRGANRPPSASGPRAPMPAAGVPAAPPAAGAAAPPAAPPGVGPTEREGPCPHPQAERPAPEPPAPVSYTHLTLPTNREV